MLRILTAVAAAFLTMAGAAAARTVVIADEIAQRGGLPADGLLDLGDVTVRFLTPQRLSREVGAEDLAYSPFRESRRTHAALVKIPAERASMTAIEIKGKFKITNLRFNHDKPGPITTSQKTLVVNGVAYHFAELAGMTLKDSLIVLRSGGSRPTSFTLEAFDIEALETPLPGAGLLMLAGLAGIGFAISRRKAA